MKTIFVIMSMLTVSVCKGQFVVNGKADRFFFEASSYFLSYEIDSAEFNFKKARKEYELLNNRERMNECSMGLASIEFVRGNYKKAMELFKWVRTDHVINNPTDYERLMLIEQNIMACGEKLQSKNTQAAKPQK